MVVCIYSGQNAEHGLVEYSYGGDFVIISNDLYDGFETFKKKVYSYVDRAFSIVKAV